jgi:hypothetical protein
MISKLGSELSAKHGTEENGKPTRRERKKKKKEKKKRKKKEKEKENKHTNKAEANESFDKTNARWAAIWDANQRQTAMVSLFTTRSILQSYNIHSAALNSRPRDECSGRAAAQMTGCPYAHRG